MEDRIPSIRFLADTRHQIHEQFRKSIFVKTLGTSARYLVMVDRLRKLWNTANFDAIFLGNGYSLINFESSVYYKRVLSGGPYFAFEHFLHVEKWRPKFIAKEATIKTAVAWVRIPGLPLEYIQNEEVILDIMRLIGKPIRLDTAAAQGTRGLYARACLELDLEKPLIARSRIDGIVRRIEYESLPTICYECGKVGHRRENCVTLAPSTTTNSEQIGKISSSPVSTDKFGAWMHVTKRKRNYQAKPNSRNRPPMGQTQQDP